MTNGSGKAALFALLGIVGVFIALVVIFLVSGLNARSTRANYESSLQGQFAISYASLGNCETKIIESLQLTREQSDRFQKVIQTIAATAATSGQSANVDPGTLRGGLTPLLINLYPDTSQLNAAYERVYNTAIGCRDDFFKEQERTIDIAKTYKAWIRGSASVAMLFFMSFPSDGLEFQLGDGTTLRGSDALDKALKPISTSTATDEFKTGALNPVITTPTTTSGG